MDKELKKKLKDAVAERDERRTVKNQLDNANDLSGILSVFKGLAETLKNIVFPGEIKISNQIDEVKIKGGVEIANKVDVVVENPVKEVTVLNPQKDVEVVNDIKLKKPDWYKEFSDKDVIDAISGGFKWLSVQIKAKAQEVSLSKHTKPDNALAVKIYDAKGKIVSDFGGGQMITASPSGGASTGTTPTNQDKLAKYRAADIDSDASPNYYGFVDLSGNWFILRESISAGADAYRYAAGTSNYTTNWTGRTSLSYDYLYNVAIV